MTRGHARQIKDWMISIGETDEDLMDEYLNKCKHDPEALDYFLMRAQELKSDHLVKTHRQAMSEIKNHLK